MAERAEGAAEGGGESGGAQSEARQHGVAGGVKKGGYEGHSSTAAEKQNAAAQQRVASGGGHGERRSPREEARVVPGEDTRRDERGGGLGAHQHNVELRSDGDDDGPHEADGGLGSSETDGNGGGGGGEVADGEEEAYARIAGSQRPKRRVAVPSNYSEVKRRRRRTEGGGGGGNEPMPRSVAKAAYMDPASARKAQVALVKKIELGPAAIDRIVKRKYDWQDGEYRKNPRMGRPDDGRRWDDVGDG